jgi:hypothetical protein
LEPAVPVGTDTRVRARILAQVHSQYLSGGRVREAPRPVISESWQRVLGTGMDPGRGRESALLEVRELEHRRRGTRLAQVLPTLRASLVTIAEQACNIMVVADADGRVLWREGNPAVRGWADRLGFVPGSNWCEDIVGTNAIGTALVVGRGVQVYSAEHFLVSHHPWTCSAAPVRDPRSGSVLGVVDLSGPVSTVHPSTLALAMTAARLAETELRHAHRWELERLRAVAAPILAGRVGRALVTDGHGWVAAASGVAPVERVLLPSALPGPTWLPAFGACSAEPVPGGWLIRLDAGESPGPVEVVLDLRRAGQAWLRVAGSGGGWRQRLTPRHAEVLFVLACHPAGRSAAQLAQDLFGDARRTVTVRAEMSRLRRHFAGVLAHRPYRFAESVSVRVELPDDGVPLPASRAPAVRRHH